MLWWFDALVHARLDLPSESLQLLNEHLVVRFLRGCESDVPVSVDVEDDPFVDVRLVVVSKLLCECSDDGILFLFAHGIELVDEALCLIDAAVEEEVVVSFLNDLHERRA